ncbi:MAG: MarR family winged helix-turn-helix transcriptional regulator [Pseudomonadota bacterium]|nr:MarR family winged helix-turn-helix transcriptional regulator [Pseudomonadota bacterium]
MRKNAIRPVAPSASPSARSPHGCSSQKVRVLSRRISQHFDHIVASSGLKTTQYSLLTTIVRFGPLRPGELAKTMNLDASTLTRNLQPLISAGWVVAGPGDDERSRLVEATASGRDKRAEGQRAWKRAQLAFNDRIGEAAVARLHAAVEECMALLDAVDESPA